MFPVIKGSSSSVEERRLELARKLAQELLNEHPVIQDNVISEAAKEKELERQRQSAKQALARLDSLAAERLKTPEKKVSAFRPDILDLLQAPVISPSTTPTGIGTASSVSNSAQAMIPVTAEASSPLLPTTVNAAPTSSSSGSTTKKVLISVPVKLDGNQRSNDRQTERKGNVSNFENKAKIERMAALRLERSQRTLRLISDPVNQTLYTMELERQYLTDNKLSIVVEEVEKQFNRKSNLLQLVKVLNSNLQTALFGCAVHTGVCSDASASEIEFISDQDYVRKAKRGQSTCFECLDQEDVVLQTTSMLKKGSRPVNQLALGETVVFVPMFGKSGPVGVIEVHGLYSEGITNSSSFERPIAPLRAMISAGDYKFTSSVRLWRLPGQRCGGIVPDSYNPDDYNKSHYQIVCGRITEVNPEKEGVPYPGGPRYTVQWEDGLVESALTATELLKTFANTPQSLGCCSPLDEKMTDSFLRLGKDVGQFVESQRRKDIMADLIKRIHVPNLTEADISERALDAILSIIQSRETHLFTFNESTREAVELISRYPKNRGSERKYTLTIHDLYVMMRKVKKTKIPNVFDESSHLEWICIELDLPETYMWRNNPFYQRLFVAVIRVKIPNRSAAMTEIDNFHSAVHSLEGGLRIMFEKDRRGRFMNEMVKKVEGSLIDWKDCTPADLCQRACNMLSEILPGASIYAGLIAEGGSKLEYVAANSLSRMLGRILNRGEGVSFDAIDKANAITIRSDDLKKGGYLNAGSPINIRYGKVFYPGTVVAFRGHETYDVRYDEGQKVEAGVDISRIVPLNVAFRLKIFGASNQAGAATTALSALDIHHGRVQLPFVCIPLKHRSKAVGVIGVDNFSQVPHAPYDPQPELILQKTMEQFGRIFGTTIDVQRKKQSLKEYNILARNPNTTQADIFKALNRVLSSNLLYMTGVLIVEVVSAKFLFTTERSIQIVYEQGTFANLDDMKLRLSHYHPTKSSQKRVQLHGDGQAAGAGNSRDVWLLCKLNPEAKKGEGKIFIISIATGLRQPMQDCDLEFLEVVQNMSRGILQNLSARKAFGTARHEALTEIKRLCAEYRLMDRYVLFSLIMEKVSMCFYSANVYVGKLGIHNQEISYIMASQVSNMKGKVLSRKGAPAGLKRPSFACVDEMKQLIILENSPILDTLYHFGPREQFEFPFVVTPIAAHLDCPIGVLGVDNCEDPSVDSEQTSNISGFFRSIATYLGNAIKGYLIEELKIKLKAIPREAVTFRHGIVALKKLLLDLIPYAMRVAEVVFEPALLPPSRLSLATATSSNLTEADVDKTEESFLSHKTAPLCTTEEYLLLVHILRFEITSPITIKAPITISCNWQGKSVFKTRVVQSMFDSDAVGAAASVLSLVSTGFAAAASVTAASGHTSEGATKVTEGSALSIHDSPFTILIPKDVLVDHVHLQIAVKGQVDGKEREVARHSIPLNYFLNVPLHFTEHTLDSSSLDCIHVGKMTLLSKIFTPTQILAFTITEISVKGLANADDFSLSDPFVIIHWNGTEVYRLPVQQDTLDPCWSQLQCNLRLPSTLAEIENCELIIAVWDEDALGRGDFLGQMSIQGSDALLEIFGKATGHTSSAADAAHKWKNLGKSPSISEGMQKLVQGRMKISGFVMTAAEMNEGQMINELEIAHQLTNLGGGSSKDEVIPDSNNEKTTKYLEFEIGLLAARDLLCMWHPMSKNSAQKEAYAVVTLNGEEIGRSSTVACVPAHNTSANWGHDDETFLLRISAEDGIEVCVLMVELFILGAKGKGEFVGCVELTGSTLANLVGGMSQQVKWFDMSNYLELSSDSHANYFIHGELMLSGRPRAVAGATKDDDQIWVAEERGFLEFSVLGGTNLVPPETMETLISVHRNNAHAGSALFSSDTSKPLDDHVLIEAIFNGRLIFRSSPCADMENPIWNEEKATFRQPNSKSLYQSTLEIIVWTSDSYGKKGFMVSHAVLTGSVLSKLITPRGCKTLAIPLVTNLKRRDDASENKQSELCGEVKVRAGPLDGLDIIEHDDGEQDLGSEFWIDILCASHLPTIPIAHLQSIESHPHQNNLAISGVASLPQVYCAIIWNGIQIGRTKINKRRTVHPLWKKQRFSVRPRKPNGFSCELTECTLRIEIFHRWSVTTGTNRDDILLAFMELEGLSLTNFLASPSGFAEVRWFGLQNATLTEAERNDRYHPLYLGEIKLRGGKANIPHDPAVEFSEFSVEIMAASGLVKKDSFSSTDPFVIVLWNGVEVGRTVTHTNTLKPNFKENFLLRVPFGQQLEDQNLIFNVWNANPKPTPNDFLGCVIFDGQNLVDFVKGVVPGGTLDIESPSALPTAFHADGADDVSLGSTTSLISAFPMEYLLVPSPEMTADENLMVQPGSKLTLKGRRVAIRSGIIRTSQKAIVHIVAGRELPRASMFSSSGSDVYFKLFRRYSLENDKEIEIFKSQVYVKATNPDFNERITTAVPYDIEDWEDFMLRIELWDVNHVFLGGVLLEGESARSLLSRANDKIFEDELHYPLTDVTSESWNTLHDHTNSDSKIRRDHQEKHGKHIQGHLILSGGILEYIKKYELEQEALVEKLQEEQRQKEKDLKHVPTEKSLAIADNKTSNYDETGAEAVIRIFRAHDLPKADVFLGKSDPFCIIRWNEREIGRTAVIKSNINPKWSEESFTVNLNSLNNPFASLLEIEVFDMDAVGAGDFLGMVRLTGNDLAAMFTACSGGSKEIEVSLKAHPDRSPQFNKFALKGKKSSIFINISSPTLDAAALANDKARNGALKNSGSDNSGAMTFKLSVKKAIGLPKSSYFGSAAGSNPYVSVFWRDDSTPIHKTSPVNGTVNPVFENEFCLLEKPEGVNLADLHLRIVVFNKNTIMADDFLGEVYLDHAAIMAIASKSSSSPAVANIEDLQMPLKASSFFSSGKMQDRVKGELSFSLHKMSLQETAMANMTMKLPEGMKEFEICVQAAANLPKANAFGQGLSDPFCIVRWNGMEIGRSTVVQDCLDPIWEQDEFFVFRAINAFGIVEKDTLSDDKTPAVKKTKQKQDEDARLRREMELTIARDRDIINSYELTIDVYDWNRFGSGVFLGCIELRGQQLIDFVTPISASSDKAVPPELSYKRQWFDLTTTSRLKERDQKLVTTSSGSAVALMVGQKTPSDRQDLNGKDIELVVHAARSLPRADTFGTADPYVRIRFNNKFIGKTSVIKNNLNPKWGDDEKFMLRLPGDVKLSDSILYLEVWDWDIAGRGNFLGALTVKEDTLVELVTNSRFAATALELGPSEYLPTASQDLVTKGSELDIKLGFAGKAKYGSKEIKEKITIQKFIVAVHGASSIAPADEIAKTSDPFVIVTWTNNEIGRTPSIPHTLNPEWSESSGGDDQEFELNIDQHSRLLVNALRFELWDVTSLKQRVFLGCVELVGAQLRTILDQAMESGGQLRLKIDIGELPAGSQSFFGQLVTVDMLSLMASSSAKVSNLSDDGDGTSIVPDIPNIWRRPKGKLEISFKRMFDIHDVEVTVPQAIKMKWFSESEEKAGQPIIDITVLRGEGLRAAKFLQNKSDPYCLVSWDGVVVGKSLPASRVTNAGDNGGESGVFPIWGKEEGAYFSIRPNTEHEMKNSTLWIDLWDHDVIRGDKAEFLGRLEINYWSLIRMSQGVFTLPLRPIDKTLPHQVKGKLVIAVIIRYPIWDSVKSFPPKKLMRKIKVLGAVDIPLVNEQLPSTKCHIVCQGVIKAKSMVISKNNNPSWPSTHCDVTIESVDLPVEVVIQVIHVDILEKKDVVIGEYVVPFDLLLRYPSTQMDAFLGPPSSTKKQSTKYSFVVGGTLVIQISELELTKGAMDPWTNKLEIPATAYSVRDVCLSSYARITSTKDAVVDGAALNSEEMAWIGTAYEFNAIRQVPARPEWIVIPIHDLGMRIGNASSDLVGSKPGLRYALCLERSNDHRNTSDTTLLTEVYSEIEQCVLELRRKDTWRIIRERALQAFVNFTNDYIKQDSFSSNVVLNRLINTLLYCFPGTSPWLALACPDGSSYEVNIYDTMVPLANKSDETNSSGQSKKTTTSEESSGSLSHPKRTAYLMENQGYDFDGMARNPPRSIVMKSLDDFKQRKNIFTSYHSFANSSFPRISVPLVSGDSTTGCFGIEQFDIYRGYSSGSFGGHVAPLGTKRKPPHELRQLVNSIGSDEKEVKKWLEDLGEICGKCLYNGREMSALKHIETYLLSWNSSRPGLIAEILQKCMAITTSCRLMEVWNITHTPSAADSAASDSDPVIQNLSYLEHSPMTHSGRLVNISSLKVFRSASAAVKPKSSDSETHLPENPQSVDSAVVSLSAHDQQVAIVDTASGPNRFGFGNIRSGFAGLRNISNQVNKQITSLASNALNVSGASKAMQNISSSIMDITKATITQSHDANHLAETLPEVVVDKDLVPTGTLLGIYYGNLEHTQLLRPVSPLAQGESHHSLFSSQKTEYEVAFSPSINITSERTISISVYEVNDDLRIINQYNGKLNLISLEEKHAHVKLSLSYSSVPPTSSPAASMLFGNYYDVEIELTWPNSSLDNKGSGTDLSQIKNLDKIKSFELTIVQIKDLLPVDKSGLNDVVCEVIWNGKVLAKSKVKEKTLSPIFEETFKLTYQGTPSSVVVEIYSMSFMGRGQFLGKIELPFHVLAAPLEASERVVLDFPLKHKVGMNAKKQAYVGGIVSLSFNVHYNEIEKDNPIATSENAELVTVPRTIWAMNTPAIKLNISHATNLGKANLFGGGSDPFVLVYLSSVKEPLFRTKVQEASINPVFDETFIVNLGVSLDPMATTLQDFPTIRLEVYDFNRIAKGEFLGLCEITPIWYFKRKSGEFDLQPNPEFEKKGGQQSRKNRLVQGSLSVSFELMDNIKQINRPQYIVNPITKAMDQLTFLEVHVLKGRNLMITNRVGGKSDPYVKVFWQNKSRPPVAGEKAEFLKIFCGKTSCKKNTLDPTWTDEKILINLTDIGFQNIPFSELIIEVWDQDFFTEGTFMGELRISPEVYLHGDIGNTEAELQQRPAESVGNRRKKDKIKIKGTLTYKLSIRYSKQGIVVMEREHNPVTTFVKPLEVANIKPFFDPDEEMKRQKLEKSAFPAIVSKAREKKAHYLNNPFIRTSLLSELHYGQLISSFRRLEHTVMKTTLLDMLCIPIEIQDAALEMDAHAKAAQSAAQLLAAKAAEKDPKATRRASADATSNTAKSSSAMFLISKYDAGKLPRRDVQFLEKVKNMVTRGLAIVSKREQRKVKYTKLQENSRAFANVTGDPADLMIQAQFDSEGSMAGCTGELFLFESHGLTLRKTLRGVMDMFSHANDYLTLACRLCRYGFILQFYRGTLSIYHIEWTNVSQMALVPIEQVNELIEIVEGPLLVPELLRTAGILYNTGCCTIPILGPDDQLLGLFNVAQFNRLPPATYKMKVPKQQAESSQVDSGAPLKNIVSGNGGEDDFEIIDMRGPEDGVSSAIRDQARFFGPALMTSRQKAMEMHLKGMRMRPEITCLEVVRTILRALVHNIPAIREISIWAVDMDIAAKTSTARKVLAVNGNNQAIQKAPISGKLGFLSRGASFKTLNSNTVSANARVLLSSESTVPPPLSTSVSTRGRFGSLMSMVSFRGSNTSSASIRAGIQPSNLSLSGIASNSGFDLDDNIADNFEVEDTRQPSAIIAGYFGMEGVKILADTPADFMVDSQNLGSGVTSMNIGVSEDSLKATRKPAPKGSVKMATEQADAIMRARERTALKAATWFVNVPRAILSVDHPHQLGMGDETDDHLQTLDSKGSLRDSDDDTSTTTDIQSFASKAEAMSRVNSADFDNRPIALNPRNREQWLFKKNELNLDIVSLIYDEIRRCTMDLNQKTFRVASGHLLASFGDGIEVQELMRSILDPQKMIGRFGFEDSEFDAENSGSSASSGIRNTAPQPSGPPPPSVRDPKLSPRISGTANVRNAVRNVKSDTKDGASRSEVPPPTPPPLPTIKPPSRANKTSSDAQSAGRPSATAIKYFIAVKTHGLGSETGWGFLGDFIQKSLTEAANILDGNLARLYKSKEEAKRRNAVSSRSALSQPSASTGSNDTLAENQLDRDDDIVLKNSNSEKPVKRRMGFATRAQPSSIGGTKKK